MTKPPQRTESRRRVQPIEARRQRFTLWAVLLAAFISYSGCRSTPPVDHSPRFELLDGVLRAEEQRASASQGPIVTALLGEDDELRERAALAAGRLRSRESRLGLEAILLGESSLETRQMAAWALGRLRDRRSVPVLRGLVDQDHAWALDALLSCSSDEAARRELDRRLDGEDSDFAHAAVLAVARGQIPAIADHVSAARWSDIFQRARDERTRWAAFQMIADSRDASFLERHIEDANLFIRRVAQERLSKRGSVEGFGLTLSRLADDTLQTGERRVARAALDAWIQHDLPAQLMKAGRLVLDAELPIDVPATHDYLSRAGPGKSASSFDAGRRRSVLAVLEIENRGQCLIRLESTNAPQTVRRLIDSVLRANADHLSWKSIDPFESFVLELPRRDTPAQSFDEVSPTPIRRGSLYVEGEFSQSGLSIAARPRPDLYERATVVGKIVTGQRLLDHLSEDDKVRLHVY